MAAVLGFLKVFVLGFLGLIVLLFVLALLFGKRMVKKWEFEAEFRDERGKEFGEFEIELSHEAKKETLDTFKAEFSMREASLEVGQRVQVYLDDDLVLEGAVTEAGRVYLGNDAIKTQLTQARAGQVCRVVFGGVERFAEAIVPD